LRRIVIIILNKGGTHASRNCGRNANMTDDQLYQNWLQGRSPEQQQANGDMAEICVKAIVVLACIGSIAYLAELCVRAM